MRVDGWDIGAGMRHAAGHDCGGDRTIIRHLDGTMILAIIDVLGHGPGADRVARHIETFFDNVLTTNPQSILRMLDSELAGSLGAAVGVVTLPPDTARGSFAGVGNTVCKTIGAVPKTMVSIDGVIGQRAQVPEPTALRLSAADTIVMHSDGVSSHIDWAANIQEITTVDVGLVAKEIIRRFGVDHDDVSCIVARRTS